MPDAERSRAQRVVAVAALVVAAAAQSGAAALAALIATNVLPVAERGVMVIALTVPALLAPVVSLGIGAALRGLLPGEPPGAGRASLIASYTRLAAGTVLAGAALIALAVIASSTFTEAALRAAPMVAGAVLLGVASLLSLQVTEAWFSAGLFRLGAWWAAAGAIGGLIALAVVAATDPSAGSLLSAQGGATLAIGFAGAGHALSRGVLGRGPGTPRWRSLLLARGARSLGVPLGGAVIVRADRLVLAAFAGPRVVAVYALAATVAEAVRLVPLAAAQLVTNDIAAGRGATSLRRPVAVGLAGAAAVGVIAWAAMSAWCVAIFGEAYADAVRLLAILLLAEVGFTLFVFAERALVGFGWTAQASIACVVGGLAAVPAYALGSSVGGADGAAWACVILYTMLGTLTQAMLAARRRRNAGLSPGGDRR